MARYTLAHWGVSEIERDRLVPWRNDPDPSPIGGYEPDDVDWLRIARPAVRASWLEHGPGAAPHRRGRERFVEIGWEEALGLVAGELRRVIRDHGNQAIFGGSYGWASAGRFHHSVGQLHRFLNTLGGFVRHTDSYSLGAGRVLLPHIVMNMDDLMHSMTSFDVMAAHTELFVSFGGVPLKNTQISAGGAGRHRVREGLRRMAAAGTRFINVSPVADDLQVEGEVEWVPIRPGTDTALMLAVAWLLETQGRVDRAFIDRCTTGYEQLRDYVLGRPDGLPKHPTWAARITGVPQARIERLAETMVGHRTMLNVVWSLQRATYGEQPFWMLVALAAMLGQIGLPGGGFGLGYGAMNALGSDAARLRGPTLPQGRNPVEAFIPCARLADMLLHPGQPFRYNGETHRYPEIRLVYWAGGNPFHHHQDLNGLERAWAVPETIIVHEPWWTATAKRADIVLPATTTLERDDIGFSTREGCVVAMRKLRSPRGQARDDFAIFAGLAERLGAAAFTEGLGETAWLRRLYGEFSARAEAAGIMLPTFDDFWEEGLIELPRDPSPRAFLAAFRADPNLHRLPTASGRIEIGSAVIAGFGEASCAGHPRWYEPEEWLGGDNAQGHLHLLTDQPARRLHSQLDHARWSRAGKVGGREPIHLNEADARARGIADGTLVRVANARGACLAVASLSRGIMPGVAKLATGAWLDLGPDGLDRHGNPNVLTLDRGSSALSQGCSAQTCLVLVTPFEGPAPTVNAHSLPKLAPIEV